MLCWEEMCKPKKIGGVNLRSTKDVNCALLARLALRVLTCVGDAWCESLKAKYGVTAEDGAHLRPKQRSTQIW